MSPQPSNRFVGLDVLRALAAVAVVIAHIPLVFASSTSDWAVEVVQNNLGSWGVGMFFVLSGLCIHLPISRKRLSDPHFQLAVQPYALRRFLRIYPPHFVALVASAVIGTLLPAEVVTSTALSSPTLFQFVAHVFLVHSFFPSANASINSVLWTIAVETHFYFLYPLLLRALRWLTFGRVTTLLFLLSVGIRGAGLLIPEPIASAFESNFPCRLWEWCLGCVVAERVVSAPRKASWRTLLFATIGSFGALLIWKALPRFLFGVEMGRLVANEVAELLAPFMYAGIVFLACGCAATSNSAVRLLHKLGLESYSLYLTHPITLAVWIYASFGRPQPWWLSLGVGVGASLAVSALFFRLVERPFMSSASRVPSAAK